MIFIIWNKFIEPWYINSNISRAAYCGWERQTFSTVISHDRSTPCPSVKHGDEWGEPSKCESADACQYCHSRTEQQFHPEVAIEFVLYQHNTQVWRLYLTFASSLSLPAPASISEIYKSTKCNDMRQTGYCPRGPFCAFAHVESESFQTLFQNKS